MREIIKRDYSVRCNDGLVTFIRSGKEFFEVPASAYVNGIYSNIEFKGADENSIEYSSETEKMIFRLYDDCISVSFERKAYEDMPIYESKMFLSTKAAMDLKGFDRAFCTQPRGNDGHNMDYYHHLPDLSVNGYFTPPMLEISLGSPDGWVALGLLDIPDTSTCKMDNDFSFLVETCGGNKVISSGDTYKMPEILIMFPKDEWDAITLFRNKLMEFGKYTPKKPKYSELPDWWKNPFVCTYGDQLIEDRVGQLISDEWVEEFVDLAEKDWGLEKVNLIIDDSWQLPHCFEPKVDEKRFPDFRKFIDKLHERGHHVLLWQTPLFDKITNGFKTRAERLGVLSTTEFKPPLWGKYFEIFPGCFAIDYTADNARQFIKEIVEMLFGDKPGQYNADGMKLDFLGLLRDPSEVASYAHPEKGIGYKEILHFYEMFCEEAKKVKPDVIIDATVGDPRFEHTIDFNRLHDTHSGVIEKEMRARLVSLGCPDLPIDSDGALMFNSWLKNHYIGAALYSVPSNYYIKVYEDMTKNRKGEYIYGEPDLRKNLSVEEKKQMGTLLSMVKYRPDGYVFMESFGNWVLKDGETVNGITQRGETVVYYPTETNDTGYIFTYQDEIIIIPLHGRKISQLNPPPKKGYLMVDYARDQAMMRLTPGVLHTFKNIDAGDSIQKVFTDGIVSEVEKEITYVNQ